MAQVICRRGSSALLNPELSSVQPASAVVRQMVWTCNTRVVNCVASARRVPHRRVHYSPCSRNTVSAFHASKHCAIVIGILVPKVRFP